MRTQVLLVMVVALAAGAALADVAPAPSCPEGQHDEYFRGHHCVQDGFKLTESKEPPGYVTVADPSAPTSAKTAKPAAPNGKSDGCAAVAGCGLEAMIVALTFGWRRRSRL